MITVNTVKILKYIHILKLIYLKFNYYNNNRLVYTWGYTFVVQIFDRFVYSNLPHLNGKF